MKKLDIVVIILVLLLAVGFYGLYFSANKITGELMIVVYYKNQVVHEEVLKEDTDIIVDIKTEGTTLLVALGDGEFKVRNDIGNVDARYIENTVRITHNLTRMIHANCDDQLCMNMRIGSKTSAPIVCTNGVVVKLSSDEFVIGV